MVRENSVLAIILGNGFVSNSAVEEFMFWEEA